MIIKITDSRGDYDFELVESVPTSSLKDKIVTIDDMHFSMVTKVTQEQYIKARKTARENLINDLRNMGTVITDEHRKLLREKQLRTKMQEEDLNPLELEE